MDVTFDPCTGCVTITAPVGFEIRYQSHFVLPSSFQKICARVMHLLFSINSDSTHPPPPTHTHTHTHTNMLLTRTNLKLRKIPPLPWSYYCHGYSSWSSCQLYSCVSSTSEQEVSPRLSGDGSLPLHLWEKRDSGSKRQTGTIPPTLRAIYSLPFSRL